MRTRSLRSCAYHVCMWSVYASVCARRCSCACVFVLRARALAESLRLLQPLPACLQPPMTLM